MKKILILALIGIIAVCLAACKKSAEKAAEKAAGKAAAGTAAAKGEAKTKAKQTFKWQVDQFADIRILRYQVPGFEELTPRQKELIYYLSEAALWWRDIAIRGQHAAYLEYKDRILRP